MLQHSTTYLGGVGVVAHRHLAVGAAQQLLPAVAHHRLLGLQAAQTRHRVKHCRTEVHCPPKTVLLLVFVLVMVIGLLDIF